MVATWKKEEVDALTKKIKESKVVGLVGIRGIPSSSFQQMRKSLTGKIDLRVTRNRLIRRAIEKAKANDLEPYIAGETGIVFSSTLNPFQVEKLFSESRTSAPAKSGSISPIDITIPAGDTGLSAGPVIGELQQAGIKAKIESGKIVVTEDSKVVSKDEPISSELATVLTRLGIEPFEIGFDLHACLEDGVVYPSDVLRIDTDEVLGKFSQANQQALNLAFNAQILNKTTMPVLLSQAYSKARTLAIEAKLVNKETIKLLIAEAGAQAASLNATITGQPLPQAQPEPAAKEEAKEEKKEEDDKKTDEEAEEDASAGMAALFG